MSVLVRRLGRLRGAYSTLLKLNCDSDNYRHGLLGKLIKRNRSTTSATEINGPKIEEFAVPAITTTGTANEDDVYDGPKKIPENTYAHTLFLNSLKYTNTVMQPNITYAYVQNKEALQILDRDWSTMTSAETTSAVKKLSYNLYHNGNERIDPFKYIKVFNELNTKNLTNDDLMTIMRHLIPFNKNINYSKHVSYTDLCTRINRECIIRFSQLPKQKMLYLCDITYQMTPKTHQYSSEFIWHSIRNIGNKPQKLNPQELVQVLFFLNICRRPPINMYELEYRLEQCIDDLSINEVAIAALGFFKTSTKIKSIDLVKNIIQRTINEIDVVDTVSIAAIVKLVRFSMTLAESKLFSQLINVLTPYEPKYTLMTLAHIAQACGRSAIYEKELVDKIIKRLNKEIKFARLKDFERFLYAFCIFNIDSNNNIYQKVIKELSATWDTTRESEIKRFPHAVSRIMGYLATQNVYPINLIKRVMDPVFVNKICRSNYQYLSREYCVLDYGLRIEVPEYDGPFLKSSICSFLEKKYYEFADSLFESTRANTLLTNVLVTCQELFHTTSDVLTIRALPHFATHDIVFCLDEQNRLVPSSNFLSQFESSDIKRVDKENLNNFRWVALVIGHSGLLIRRYNTPTGSLASKIRQLAIIGYTPIMISHVSWDALKSAQEKRNYIKELLFRDIPSKLSNTV
ncbi:hypothetical protein PUN28_018564 [Cardiocondyla obscurior]